jgi:nucleotide-binding universal stress UspA family protein
VPTDGSELSNKAVGNAVELAVRLKASLVGMTVTEPYPYATMAPHTPIESHAQHDARMQAVAEERLAVFKQAAASVGLQAETVVKSSASPFEAILEAARERGCDGIVMSSHGRRGLSGLLLGSETQKVLTHSTVPVLVIR